MSKFTSGRLAALSSLFKHLVRHGHADANPVAEVEHPAINRQEGSTLTFSKADAARLLNAPAEGLRDRAILSVGLQVGLWLHPGVGWASDRSVVQCTDEPDLYIRLAGAGGAIARGQPDLAPGRLLSQFDHRARRVQ